MDNINEKIQRFVKKETKKEKGKYFPAQTEEELLSVLIRVGNGKRLTEKKYRELRLETDPNPLTYYRRFGSWNNACEMAFGKEVLDPSVILGKECDEKYLVSLINEFKIKDKTEYLLKRKTHPDIFPSQSKVEKLFKNFKTLFKAAEQFSLDEQLMLCLKIKLELNKTPTIAEYKEGGVNTCLLLKRYYTQREINRLVRLLEEGYEKSRRDQRETIKSDGKMSEREKEKVFTPFSKQLSL